VIGIHGKEFGTNGGQKGVIWNTWKGIWEAPHEKIKIEKVRI
jgi:hypothetical protein